MNFKDQTEQIEYYLGKDSFPNYFFEEKKLLSAFDFTYDNDHNCELKTISYKNFGLPEQELFALELNNLGFRSLVDWDIESLSKYDQIILCMGCSDTLGPNLDIQNTWPFLLQQRFDSSVAILNLGGMSFANDTISRLLYNFTACLPNVTHVCLIWPLESRREFVMKDVKMLVTAQTPIELLPMFHYWNTIDRFSNSYNLHKNKILCNALCESRNIKLFDLVINRKDERYNFDVASMYKAFGPKTNEALANYFFKKINGQPSTFEMKQHGILS